MNNERPLILVTNDDGVNAEGLEELADAMRPFGDVVVIAPEWPMSGMSGAITFDKPLRISLLKNETGFSVYKCSGTPVDCVKMAFNHLLDKRPDFVVSGINHGSNTSMSVVYSGTVGAAIEGAIHGVPSIAFSLCDYEKDADFGRAKIWVARIFQTVIETGLMPFTCLNVNIPSGEIKGINVCRQTIGKWVEELEHRTDPRFNDYYWLAGRFHNFEPSVENTDIFAIEKQNVAIVPIKVDMTCYDTLQQMQNWKF